MPDSSPPPAPPREAHSGQTFAPWTPEQVVLLNNYQTTSGWHPFTCGSGKCSHVALVAHEDGWRCPSCDYRQGWAHNFMTRPWPNPRLWSPEVPARAAQEATPPSRDQAIRDEIRRLLVEAERRVQDFFRERSHAR